MGNINCNSAHPVHQRCKACVGKYRHSEWPADKFETCDCTLGLDHTCAPGKCAEWQKQMPGSYDAQYRQWMFANPEPVKPEFVPMPDIVAGDFICTQCTQCQDFSKIVANDLNIDNASQVMSCIGKMEEVLSDQKKATAAAAAAAAKAASTTTATTPTSSLPTSTPTSTPTSQPRSIPVNTPTSSPVGSGYASREEEDYTAVYVFLFILLVVIAIVVMLLRSGQQTPTQQYAQYAQQQYTQPQYTQPQYAQPQYAPMQPQYVPPYAPPYAPMQYV
jgi:hypothetical protein